MQEMNGQEKKFQEPVREKEGGKIGFLLLISILAVRKIN